MAATYTFDVFSSLDGYGAAEGGGWGGYWGQQGPELLAHRLAEYAPAQRMVLGATTFRTFARFFDEVPSGELDPWCLRLRNFPATVFSSTLDSTLGWPDARVVSGDAVAAVREMKESSEVPIRSHGSLSLNRALMAAGLVDRIQVTIFPALTGRSGTAPVFAGLDDYDLVLLSHRSMDARSQELVYRPTLHRPPT